MHHAESRRTSPVIMKCTVRFFPRQIVRRASTNDSTAAAETEIMALCSLEERGTDWRVERELKSGFQLRGHFSGVRV